MWKSIEIRYQFFFLCIFIFSFVLFTIYIELTFTYIDFRNISQSNLENVKKKKKYDTGERYRERKKREENEIQNKRRCERNMEIL